MMLIPTAFQRLPSSTGCHNGQLLFGGAAAQMASALAQLNYVKFLNQAHYYVGRSVAAAEGGRRYVQNGELKGATVYNFLYQSSPLSSHLALMIKYVSAHFNATSVTMEAALRATTGNSYTASVLDVGIEFTETTLESGPDEINIAFTGCEQAPAPTNVNADPPRPLFVPVSSRGDLLNIAITTTQLLPLTVSIYDVYSPEVTP
tara:strand:+ start:5936 stop:6547 length:612 start_codon:yes stop_codon:yes gene_type:complete